MGLWAAWRPCETFAATPLVLALAALALIPRTIRYTRRSALSQGLVASAALLLLASASALAGWDPASGFARIALAAAVATLVWQASRTPVEDRTLKIFALGLALLALWGSWQVLIGFERAQSVVSELPLHMQDNASERLASGRAFASLLLPSHLAVLLATALPVLLASVRRGWSSAGWLAGSVLCVIGLILSYSPIGIGLAVAASLAVAARRRRWLVLATVGLLLVAMAAAFVVRPDLTEFRPLQLRVDNWRTASWLWTSSPVAGVGLGGYGQASQAVPFEVGNRPAHAHSLPAEWVAELGLSGVAAAALAMIAMVVLVRRLWRFRPELAAALAVVPLHNLVDFSLYTSGVALPWAVLLGWGLAATREPEREAVAHRLRPALVGMAALVVAVVTLHVTSVVVAEAAQREESAGAKLDRLAAAHRLAPWRLEAVAGCAITALESSQPELVNEAGQILESSRWLRPNSAVLAGLASRLDVARGRPSSAAAEAWAAGRAQPFVRAHDKHLEALIEGLSSGAEGLER
jgi:hypothetical protein